MFTSFKLRRIALPGGFSDFAARTDRRVRDDGDAGREIEPDSLLIRLPPRGHMTPVEIPVGFSSTSPQIRSTRHCALWVDPASDESFLELDGRRNGDSRRAPMDGRRRFASVQTLPPGGPWPAADGKLVVRGGQDAPRKLATFAPGTLALEFGGRPSNTPDP